MEGRNRGGRKSEFYRRFDTDKISQIGWLRFLEEIMSKRYDLVLYALFDLQPVKRLDCCCEAVNAWDCV